MSIQTTQGSGVKNNNGGAVLNGGNVSSRLRNNTARTSATNTGNNQPKAHQFGKIQPSQLGTAVSITAITQSGSTGYVNIQKSSHGLSVGDQIVVYGCDVTGYNTVHTVTVVTDSSNVKTSVFYSADAVTPGSYKPFSGLFNAMTAGYYIGSFIGKNTAGTSITGMRLAGSQYGRHYSPQVATGDYRYNVTSFDVFTGTVTKGAYAGQSFAYIAPQGGGAVTSETRPSMSSPGRYTFRFGGALAKSGNYNSETT